MRIGLFQGSFDPITKGHIDCIKRACALCDKLIVLLAINPDKKYMFTKEERLEMIRLCFKDFDNIKVDYYDGFTADYGKMNNVDFFVRGIRDEKDLIYEKEIEDYNKKLAPDIETIYMTCNEEYKNVSSTAVRDAIINKKDISKYVSDEIIDYILKKGDK